MNKVVINKIDAGRRQIDQAIKLFFSNQDQISIHTLSGAADQILRDVVCNENSVGLYDGILRMLPEDRKKDAIEKLNKAKNFFKHADRDPDGNLIFQHEENDFMLYDNTALYEQYTGELTDLMRIFRLWFNIKHEVHNVSLPYLAASINDKVIFFEKARRAIDDLFLSSSSNS